MNALSLVNLVSQRIPAYDPQEYLREINTEYQNCWDKVTQLDDSYFTDTKIVTVSTQAAEFDFLYNSSGNLNGPISNRYFQIDRIRILLSGNSNWVSANPRGWNAPDFIAQQQLTPQQPYTASPFLYVPFAKGSVLFAQPLAAGTQIELVYTFVYMPLTYTSAGTVISSGATVTGTGTAFTSLLPADYQLGQPGNDQDTDIGIELVLGGNQTYRVKTLTSDTALTTLNSINPAATGNGFTLAMVPDIPEGHHEVIALLATRNIAITPAKDYQLANAMGALAKDRLDSMRDSIMSRQRQEPPRRRRFPMAVMRQYSGIAGR